MEEPEPRAASPEPDAAWRYLERTGLTSVIGTESLASPDSDGPSTHVSIDFTPSLQSVADLARLHALARARRVTKVLEFGCGFSSGVLAHALDMNELEHGRYVRNSLRRDDPFTLHSVDNMEHFVRITEARIPDRLRARTKFHLTTVRMTTFNGRVCTEYAELPNITPDFIYLDGPSQFDVEGDVNGISTRSADRLPMACDILKIEHFLLPGTLILVDGRTANARFIAANLQRHWRHEHHQEDDVHYFELIEEPLGKWNRLQVEYCLGSEWRERTLTPDLDSL